MLYLYSPDQQDVYLRLLKDALPDWPIACWPEEADAEKVRFAVVWSPPKDFFARFPKLQAIFVLAAGVDALLRRGDVPQDVAIVRLTDAGMAQQMTEYCLYGLLHYQRQMDIYLQQQKAAQWIQQPARLADSLRVTVLGLGQLGTHVAHDLKRLGYRVSGWSRRPREIDGIACAHGEAGLRALLPETDVLFSVLPATPETRHLLDAKRLDLLPKDSAIINAGRGSLIDQNALLACLDKDRLRFALLDVFVEEPLPENHPFWRHPRIILTPHVAADTVPEEAARQIAASLRTLAEGGAAGSLAGFVDRARGY